MASEYLRKSIADRRTGANLIGISVDTSNMREFSPEFKIGFDELEKFARETDEMKIETEKKRLKLEIEQNMLNFKNDYLKDPTIYSSQEKWDEVSRLYEQERKKSLSKIAESKYLSSDEKTLYSKEMKNIFIRNWADPIKKRNGAIIKERLNETMTNIDMITSIASMGNFYDTEVLPRAISDIKAEYKELIKHGMSTESDMNYTLAQRISMIEGSLFSKKIESDVIYNPNLTPEQKKEEIKKAVEFLGNEERINGIVETFGKENKFDENTQKYLSLSLKEGYLKVKNTADKLIYRLESKDKRERKIYETDIADAINLGDPEKLASLTLNDKFGTTDFLGNRDDILETLTNSDVNNFYDIDSSDFFPVLTSGYFGKISKEKAELERNGYRGKQALQPLYDMVGNLSGGDNDKKAMIYKHYGYKTGLNPYALFKGEKDPDYIEAAEGLRTGKVYIANNRYSIDSEVVGTNAMGKLDLIALNFSKDNTVVGRDRAVKFVLGVLYNNDLTRKKVEADTDIALKEALNSKETYNRLFELSKKAGEFEGKKIYRQVNLKDPRLLYLKPEKKEEGQTEQQKKENEEKEKKIVENSKGW